MIHHQEERVTSRVASRPAINIVLFDYGQVLSTPPNEKIWQRMISISGLTSDTLHDAYWALRHEYDRGEYSGRRYWSALAGHAGAVLDDVQIDALLESDVELWAQPNPPMIAWAQRLQNAGTRTAVLSNIGDAMAIGLSARLPWLGRFERCIWSYTLRLAKPEAAIFREAMAVLGARPDQILFVDDKAENVTAAQTLGIHAIRYTTADALERTLRERGLAGLWEE